MCGPVRSEPWKAKLAGRQEGGVIQRASRPLRAFYDANVVVRMDVNGEAIEQRLRQGCRNGLFGAMRLTLRGCPKGRSSTLRVVVEGRKPKNPEGESGSRA